MAIERATRATYQNYDPAHPLLPQHERYAVLRAQGMSVTHAAKEAQVGEDTARQYWEPPKRDEEGNITSTFVGKGFCETGVGGAIERRIKFLRDAMASESAYTPGMLLHMQMDFISKAAQKGDYGTALKFLDKIRVEIGEHASKRVRDALPVPSEDITEALRSESE